MTNELCWNLTQFIFFKNLRFLIDKNPDLWSWSGIFFIVLNFQTILNIRSSVNFQKILLRSLNILNIHNFHTIQTSLNIHNIATSSLAIDKSWRPIFFLKLQAGLKLPFFFLGPIASLLARAPARSLLGPKPLLLGHSLLSSPLR